MRLPVPFLNATGACCSQSVGRWCHRTDSCHFQTNKQTKTNEANTECQMQGPTVREINAKQPRRDPSPLCVSRLRTCHFHCEFPWRDFAGARGSVSEGVGMEILGVCVVRIFVSKCHGCLSEF